MNNVIILLKKVRHLLLQFIKILYYKKQLEKVNNILYNDSCKVKLKQKKARQNS